MTHPERSDPPVAVGPLVAAGLGVVLLAWLIPALVVAASVRELPNAQVGETVAGTLRVIGEGRWRDPQSAYPPGLRAQMPGTTSWWLLSGGAVAMLGVVFGTLWRRVEPQVARDRLGRRPYDWRGSRPRAWARGRDLGELVRRQRRDAFTLGMIDGRRVASPPEAHVAVIAPTRSGKTTRCVIPWLFEHKGPAIVTSTKRDVLDVTRAARERAGRVWIFDPFGDDSACWDPLERCEDWSSALRQAQWLADATQDGDSEVAGYWRGEAAKLLAPLTHAAVLDGRDIGGVVEWLDDQEAREPTRILKAADAGAAARQLKSVVGLDPRNKGTTYMSAGSVLAAYRFPEVVATARRGLTAAGFFDGAPNTLYIVAGDREQHLLTPIVVALLSSLLHEAADRAAATGPLRPSLRVLVDEAANIAPLRELPRALSQAAGHGVHFATVWQSLGQMRERYGGASDTILANSVTKLFLGPVTDDATRRYLIDLLGDDPVQRDERSTRRPKVRAGALQQLGDDRALLVAGAQPPAIVATRPWWKTRNRKLR